MTDLRRMVKRNARLALTGRWGLAVAIVLVVMSLWMALNLLEAGVFEALGLKPYVDVYNTPDNFMDDLPNTTPLYLWVTLGMTFVAVLVGAPLNIGVNDWFLGLTDGAAPPFGQIFRPYGNRTFFRAVWLEISIYLRTMLWAALLSAVPAGVLAFSVWFFEQGARTNTEQALSVMGIILGAGLLLAAVVFLAAVVTRYTLAPYLLCSRYAKTVRQALRLSVHYTKGHRWEIVAFFLSFLPWLLLTPLVLPVLWIYPYMQMSTALFARYLIEAGSRKEQGVTREFSTWDRQPI